MYCPNCGAQTSSKLCNCVYCDYSLTETYLLLKGEQKQSVENLFPDLSVCNGFKVNFLGHDICYDSHFEKISKTHIILKQIYDVHCREFSEYIDKCLNLKSLVEGGIEKGDELLEKVIELIVAFLHKNAIQDITIKDIQSQIGYRVCESIEEIYNLAIELEDLDEFVKEVRSVQRQQIGDKAGGRWIGGGFGIKGALHGALNAAVLNLGTKALRRTSSAISSFVQSSMDQSQINKMKRQVFHSGEFQREMKNVFEDECRKAVNIAQKLIVPEIDTSQIPYSQKRNSLKYSIEHNQNLTEDDYIETVYYLLERYPYDILTHTTIYGIDNGKYAKSLSEIASYFVGTDKLQRKFVELDCEVLEKNLANVDDNDEILKAKWNALHEREKNNPAYSNENLMYDYDVISFKNNLFKLWTRFFKDEFMNEINKCANISGLDELWRLVEQSPPVEYFIYRNKEKEYESLIETGNVSGFIEKSKDLQKLISEKNNAAMCIWSALMTKVALNKGMDVSKYQNVILTLADKGDVLAMSLLGEYYLNGTGVVEKNKAMAESILRNAAWNYSPLATAYFGKFYANGEMGYEKNISIAEELLNLSLIYKVPFAGRELYNLGK